MVVVVEEMEEGKVEVMELEKEVVTVAVTVGVTVVAMAEDLD